MFNIGDIVRKKVNGDVPLTVIPAPQDSASYWVFTTNPNNYDAQEMHHEDTLELVDAVEK